MTEPQHEALSCLMDGELDADRTETALDNLCRDEALAAEWHRMHQVRELMRGNADPILDLRATIRTAIASEPAYLLPGVLAAHRGASRWPRYALGSALAASVALVTVVGLQQRQSPSTPELAAQAQAPSTTSAVATLPLVPRASPLESGPSQAASQLENYWAVYADNALLAGQDNLPLAHNVRVDQTQ